MIHQKFDTSRWGILRTAGPRTLPLARSLQDAGIEAWTPSETVRRRVPRSKVSRQTEVAFTPTYVFVRAPYLARLAATLVSGINPHPPFSIFRYYGETVFVSDAAIDGLREVQAASEKRTALRTQHQRSKKHGMPFDAGQSIEVTTGPFTGLPGIVQESDGRQTLVLFGGNLRIKIETSILRADGVATTASAA
jgi:transcription antitermination factor NusG